MTNENITEIKMSDQRPHLLNMFVAWFSESGIRTFIQVKASMIVSSRPLPPNAISDNGMINLSVGASACPDFLIVDNNVTLTLVFNGVSNALQFPIQACRAIYSPDSEFGLPLYNDEDELIELDSSTPSHDKIRSDGNQGAQHARPKLKLVH